MATNSSSIVILPFQMLFENSVSNAFDIQKNNINSDADSKFVYESFVKKLKKLPLKSNKLVDSSKYLDYISNYLSQENDEINNSFLKIFTIDLGKLSELNDNKEKMTFASQFQNNNKLFLGESDLEIKINEINIVLNEIAHLGYFIFKLDYFEQNNIVLKTLSEIDFYRFYKSSKVSSQNKYKIKVVNEKKDNEVNFIPLFEIINSYFSFLNTSSNFIYEKPIMLHLFAKNDLNITTESELIDLCYKVLRIPPKQIQSESKSKLLEQYQLKLQYPDNNISYCTMTEGAVIIDSTTINANELLNKYFPAFILALNQREVMLKTAKEISQIENENLTSNDKKTFDLLSKIRKKLNLIQLKQIFYNISLNNEIGLFFIDLQHKFSVDILLKDNNGSIEAIHSLLESERHKNEALENKLEEESQKKRDDNLALILGLVGLFGAASAVIDVYNFFSSPDTLNYWWLPSSVVLFLGSYLVWFYKKK